MFPCPSLSPWVCSNSSLLSQRCYPTIWSSVDPFPSCPGYFQWVGSSHQYWQFSISLSNEYSGLVSFRMDWFDLLVVQGTFKSLFQHHSSKASVLWCSAFFTVQLSHPHMTTGKTIPLTRWTFVGKVMSLPFNLLSRFVVVFLPRRKHLLRIHRKTVQKNIFMTQITTMV